MLGPRLKWLPLSLTPLGQEATTLYMRDIWVIVTGSGDLSISIRRFSTPGLGLEDQNAGVCSVPW